jgi:hypothetical protein
MGWAPRRLPVKGMKPCNQTRLETRLPVLCTTSIGRRRPCRRSQITQMPSSRLIFPRQFSYPSAFRASHPCRCHQISKAPFSTNVFADRQLHSRPRLQSYRLTPGSIYSKESGIRLPVRQIGEPHAAALLPDSTVVFVFETRRNLHDISLAS